MNLFNNLTLRGKLLSLGILIPTLLIGILFWMYSHSAREKAVNSYVEKARTICLQTESAREDMETNKWGKGVYTIAMLKEWASKNEIEKLINSVPVASAWKTAMAKAKEGDYTFKTPKISPRNPKNEPDELEKRALEALEKNNLPDYHEIDTKMNSVRYFRPVRLSENCMNCHGDPATSKDLWGNTEGRDALGMKMEGWKVGEIHGAFEVIQSLEKADTEMRSSLATGGIVAGGGLLAMVLMAFFIIERIAGPVRQMTDAAGEMRLGNMDVTLTHQSADEIGQLADAFRAMCQAQKNKIALAEAVAAGDLTAKADIVSRKDSLGIALEKMIDNLNVMAEGNEISEQVALSADQISSASQSLSEGATKSAASLEEVSSSMTEIAAQVKTNAENAGLANDLASDTRNSASKGNEEMDLMIKAMNEIQTSSNQIGKIIKVIDDIAFQTNLLALNAAVEAARAGIHGKGFGVVAEEVRNLAARSAKAAKETGEMIEGAKNRINSGNEIARRTAGALQEIVSSSTKMANLIREIASASNEQAEGIAQIHAGLSQIDQVTQQNTANAEETASSAVELASRAGELHNLLARFKLKDS